MTENKENPNKGHQPQQSSDVKSSPLEKVEEALTDEAVAEIKQVAKISKIWFVPLVAVFIGLFMVYQTWSNRGPEITIAFETAEGVEVNSTKIKLRDITIGKVTAVELNDKFDGIEVTARLEKNTEELLKSGTSFWVVKPRVGKGGISGLSTILSGAYIEISPSKAGESRRYFVGLEKPPVTPPGTPGLPVTLDSEGQFALDIGDPILYRGIKVGQIEYVYFNIEERKVYYDAFIEKPYDGLVTSNTRFWEVNGIEVELNADGLQFQTGTIETFMGGGVTFDVPENQPKGEVIRERAFFSIYANKSEVLQKQFNNAQEFVLLFGQSIRGLSPGAPVEYKGVRIGSVVRTDINYPEMNNLLSNDTLIPVLIRIEAARVGLEDSLASIDKVNKAVIEMTNRGLHGFLTSGNLLTGSKFIDLNYVEDAPVASQFYGEYPVIPTASSEIDNLLGKLDNILGTIDKLALDQLVNNSASAMGEFRKAMVEFKGASTRVDRFFDQPENQQLIKNVNNALKSIERLAADFSEGSKTHQELQNMLLAFKRTLKSLTPVLNQVNRQPNSLIFGGVKADEKTPQPSEDH